MLRSRLEKIVQIDFLLWMVVEQVSRVEGQTCCLYPQVYHGL